MSEPEQTSHRSKRSRITPILLGGVAAFGLAACEDDRIETQAFPSLSECQASAGDPSSWWTDEECATAFAGAEAAHEESAPRYADEELCEEQHDNACYAQPAPGGGGSVFLPLMAGYMMGNMLSNNRASYNPQPIYRTSTGSYATARGTALSSNRGSGQLNATAFRSAPSTRSVAPMTRASIRSTGGFGSARTNTTSRSFGG